MRAMVLLFMWGFFVSPLSAAERPVAEIPFRWTPGQIEIQVSIEGRAPIWCILDSGAEISMIDAEVAKTMDFGPIVRRGAREHLENVSVRIGTLTLKQHDFTVWALDNFRRQKRDIRGVIGCALFERFVVTLDFRKRLVILNEPRTFRPPSAARRLPIRFDGRLPLIDTALTIRGRKIPARLMVDTGASQALILRHPYATAHRLIGDKDKITTSDTVAAGKRTFIDLQVDQLDLDRWTFRSPKTTVYGSPAGAGGYTGSDGVLGNDVLRHFRVTFDYSRKQILLEEAPDNE